MLFYVKEAITSSHKKESSVSNYENQTANCQMCSEFYEVILLFSGLKP